MPLASFMPPIGAQGAGGNAPGASIDDLRWNLPALTIANAQSYTCAATALASGQLNLDPATTYNLTLLFRGEVEVIDYTGGTNDGQFFQTGGASSGGAGNQYSLTITSNGVTTTYFLNRKWGSLVTTTTNLISYSKTFSVRGDALFVLKADSIDSFENRNDSSTNPGGPVLVPGVTPYPEAYIGQFIQMNVTGVS